MAFVNYIILGILILQLYVHAAPSDVSKLEDIAKVEQADEKVVLEPTPKEAEVNNNSTDSPRQKRYYNPFAFGSPYPPITPQFYPTFNTREEFPSTGPYGFEDPLVQIHRRVQEIANIVRQPPLPPPIPHIPIFYPILIAPPIDCNCNITSSQTNLPPFSDQQSPNVSTRFPEMEDERQNWGLVVNDENTLEESSQDQDLGRPISFDPIRLNRPNARPPPPVEHGSVQSDVNNPALQPGESNFQRPPNVGSSERPNNLGNQGSFSTTRPPPPLYPENGVVQQNTPNRCDAAILMCCHQLRVAYNCFQTQGCLSVTSNGNPCNSNSILNIIQKFQAYYGNRSE